MIELPEAYVLSRQIEETLVGKTIELAVANTSPHSFAWYTDDPAMYGAKLAGKKIAGAAAYGGRVDVHADDMILSFFDGIRFRYLQPGEKRPVKHQLSVEFGDGTGIACTIQMYGGILLFPDGTKENDFYTMAKEKPSPFTDVFDEAYFDSLRRDVKPTISVKAFLATQQRIPGLGNGVLQDILFNAGIHPKRKLETLNADDSARLFQSVKETLAVMRDQGGRDAERDLFGKEGGYRMLLSSKTLASPCVKCGGALVRQAYLGGNVYFCSTCQPLIEGEK